VRRSLFPPERNQVEIGVVWNSMSSELHEVVWLASMIGGLSILSVVAGVALALILVGVT
jgi:hypothetical protein